MDRRKFHPVGVEIALTSPVASPLVSAYFAVIRHRPGHRGRSIAKPSPSERISSYFDVLSSAFVSQDA